MKADKIKMKVYVNIKQIGKRKNKIDKKEYEISDNIIDVNTIVNIIKEQEV